MAAVLSPASSTAAGGGGGGSSSNASGTSAPHAASSPKPRGLSVTTSSTLPPNKRTTLQRPSSYARARMSQYSATSAPSQRMSRPPSTLVPGFHSNLSYTVVRDFAWPISDPMHFGPPPERSPASSGQSTPVYDTPPIYPGFAGHHGWGDPHANSWPASGLSGSAGEQLPQMAYGGGDDGDHGPPYSEDEDLQSPVVVSSSRHREWPRQPANTKGYDQGYLTDVNGDGSETYYVRQGDEMADGPGGELVTYPPDHARHSHLTHGASYGASGGEGRRRRTDQLSIDADAEESRYSRDYQFVIASPDEEMHGKAVALFDFARENENELPLVEGQVIWVSYRHGAGWLVAEDPKTRESGLVPEEYVRLLRDIEGEWTSLEGLTAETPGGADPAPAIRGRGLSITSNAARGDDTLAEGAMAGVESASATPTSSHAPSSFAPAVHGRTGSLAAGKNSTRAGRSDSTSSGTTSKNRSEVGPSSNETASTGAPSTTGTAVAGSNTGNHSASGSHSASSNHSVSHSASGSGSTGERSQHKPVISTFSTSSKDLDPYPLPLPGGRNGQSPPQIAREGPSTGTSTSTGTGSATMDPNRASGDSTISSISSSGGNDSHGGSGSSSGSASANANFSDPAVAHAPTATNPAIDAHKTEDVARKGSNKIRKKRK